MTMSFKFQRIARPLHVLLVGALTWAAACGTAPSTAAGSRPNIVYILADDLGWGDVRCFNPGSRIPTPQMDRIAAEGLRFTDAHSGSAVCTPTRYGILTGRYCFRSRLKSGVLGGYSRRLIERDRLTVAELLRSEGYATACFGKWHLGMDFPLKGGGFARDYPDQWRVDYSAPIANGPTQLGFERYFGISASLDMPPYVFLHDNRATAVPTVEKQWIRKGPAAESFEAEDVLPTLTRTAVEYLEDRKKQRDGKPFFLYLPLASPHTPILPTPEWKGKSGLSPYADFVMQTDAAVGRIADALDRLGQSSNTLLIVTSDNGCSPAAGFDELVAKGHRPSGPYRGHKADIFEGGHRIPFIARWPGHIRAGARTDRLTCLTDLMATVSELLGRPLPPQAGEDSVSMLPALTGRAHDESDRRVIHHSINGSFALRKGRWKLALCPGSGGWSAPRPGRDSVAALPPVQLFDLAVDPGEKHNLQAERPDVVAALKAELEDIVQKGRSTPGPAQPTASPDPKAGMTD